MTSSKRADKNSNVGLPPHPKGRGGSPEDFHEESDEDFAFPDEAEADDAYPAKRVESASTEDDRAGRSPRGQESRRSASSYDGRSFGEHSSDDGDSLGRGPGPRDAPPSGGLTFQGDSLGDTLLQGFAGGDPEQVYTASLALIKEHALALTEIARLRFKLNFGSSFCQNCEGLRAGPNVIATCFQVQQCHFTNIKEGGEGPRHLRVIQTLLGRDPIR